MDIPKSKGDLNPIAIGKLDVHHSHPRHVMIGKMKRLACRRGDATHPITGGRQVVVEVHGQNAIILHDQNVVGHVGSPLFSSCPCPSGTTTRTLVPGFSSWTS